MKAIFNSNIIKLQEGWVNLPEMWYNILEQEIAREYDKKEAFIFLREAPRERPLVDFFGDSETATYYDLSFEDGTSLASIDSRQLEFIEE